MVGLGSLGHGRFGVGCRMGIRSLGSGGEIVITLGCWVVGGRVVLFMLIVGTVVGRCVVVRCRLMIWLVRPLRVLGKGYSHVVRW